MRLPTILQFRTQGLALSQQFERLNRLQNQAITEQKILSSADDPILADQIKSVKDNLIQLKSYDHNLTLARNRRDFKASIADQNINLINRIQELVMLAKNETRTSADLNVIEQEVSGLLDQFVDLANTRDSEGNYIYSGVNITTQPFLLLAGQYVYQGSEKVGEITIGIDTKVDYTDSGGEVFGIVGNQTIFDLLQDFMTTLQLPISTPAEKDAFQLAMDNLQGLFSQALTHFIDYQQQMANQGVVIDNQEKLADNLKFNEKIFLHEISSANLEEVITNITSQSMALELTQKIYVQLQELQNNLILS